MAFSTAVLLAYAGIQWAALIAFVCTDLVYSGGWDNTIRAWDLRSPREIGMAAIHGKVYAMDLNDDKLVVCDSMKRVRVVCTANKLRSSFISCKLYC